LGACLEDPVHLHQHEQRNWTMNSIIWVVGAVVIAIAVLSFFGLR